MDTKIQHKKTYIIRAYQNQGKTWWTAPAIAITNQEMIKEISKGVPFVPKKVECIFKINRKYITPEVSEASIWCVHDETLDSKTTCANKCKYGYWYIDDYYLYEILGTNIKNWKFMLKTGILT